MDPTKSTTSTAVQDANFVGTTEVQTSPTNAGTNWDTLKLTSLNVSASSGSPFTITGIAATGVFDNSTSHIWTIADITSGVVKIGNVTTTYNVTGGGFATPDDAANQLATDLGLTGNSPLLQLVTASLPPAPVGGGYSLGVIPDGAGASGGDDLVISFSPTPEPTVLTLLIPGIAGLALRRRRRKLSKVEITESPVLQ
jgi:hypothetical protein